ncbi:NAD(P)/FAD-dependent oxidoreductase [Rhodococcus sovatensis]|uniref:NAD(P)/FAD-dependent oxidoreductase n=1 Tax=Rhodococcus sovatensis TaxID=1805840 RepID=A0ABZ2PNH8_9NOCA
MTSTDSHIRDPHSFVPARKIEDLEPFRAKYLAERDKRLTESGAEQYLAVQFEGKFSEFDADPYARGRREIAPMTAEVDVLVIGAGFMGMTAAIGLKKAGISNIKILDVAADFGGTWYWNRYPGVRCDIESYIYFPMLEETGYVPKERYSTGTEIYEYCRLLARQFDLYDNSLFQTRVTGMEWDEDTARWTVNTDGGDVFSARFVSTQSGLFVRPHLPGIPGVGSFAGHSFHTSRWDFDYTGGDAEGNLTGLEGKRVAIIGTGATGIQAIPHLADHAQSLVVFQRTPTQVMPRLNAPTDTSWFESLPEGWHTERRIAFDKCAMDRVAADSEVDDGWIRFAKYQLAAMAEAGNGNPTLQDFMDAMERSDYEWNEMLRDRVDATVLDPATAEKLKTYYRTLCKRPGFSDVYLPTFNKESVELVDTSATPIDRITERGIAVGDREFEVDLIIYATGFEHGRSWTDKAGYDVLGRNGNRLSKKFSDGISTLHGFLSQDFPNLFFLGFTQTGAVSNFAHLIDQQANHMVYIITKAMKSGIRALEPTADAEAGWNTVMREVSVAKLEYFTACTPGQYNNEGKLADNRNPLVSGVYMPGCEFFDLLAEWRKRDDLDGLSVTS